MTKDPKFNSEDEKPKEESDLIKFFKKRSFIYLLCAVMFVVFFVPEMMQPSELDQKITEIFDSDDENHAWSILKSYKGTDDKGSTLGEIIMIQIENAYPSEKILKHHDTSIEISASDAQEEQGSGFYQVHFSFKTYDNTKDYFWHVNIQTDEIIPLNDGARKMMNIINNYD